MIESGRKTLHTTLHALLPSASHQKAEMAGLGGIELAIPVSFLYRLGVGAYWT